MAVEMKREIQGVVVAIAGNKTATVLVERRVMHPRYHKFVKRFKKYLVHDEKNELKVGDTISAVECDGRMKNRSYYTDFAQALPKDCVILTAGCAKYKYNKLALGDIGGIPRVLDAGQCNDSYSLALIALKLKEVFGLSDVNDLPIVYNIAWYEQKAVIVWGSQAPA